MKNSYESPFSSRYASDDMRNIFSQEMRFFTWRRLWVILAKAEKELGLQITDEQIKELEDKMCDINYDVADEIEKETHHDVMAHIHAYGKQCPNAAGIIHLGATSSYITDNADIIIMVHATDIVYNKLQILIRKLKKLAIDYKDIPTLAYTHYQPAQPTTVGKRICMWLQDFESDIDDLNNVTRSIKVLGCKGATGTQASFLKLFNNDYRKVEALDRSVCRKIGISSFPITGQTYPRKLDKRIYDVLSSIAVSASKMANDIRLLQHDGEISEPFGSKQVGSSAMAYKRNPLNCEKIVGLSRRVITDSINPAWTASVQWLERTLDDSSNRRLVISEGFLSIDEILDTCIKVIDGLVIDVGKVSRNLNRELPFMATENIMMSLVEQGMDRQEVHEIIRKLSIQARTDDSDLIKLISNRFDIPNGRLFSSMYTNILIGCASKQVEDYLGYEEEHIKDSTQLSGGKSGDNDRDK